jgi:hypothetical protein
MASTSAGEEHLASRVNRGASIFLYCLAPSPSSLCQITFPLEVASTSAGEEHLASRANRGDSAFLYYTRSTFPDFKARAETHTRLGFPSTKMRTF